MIYLVFILESSTFVLESSTYTAAAEVSATD